MANQLNSGSLDTLKLDQTLLAYAKKTSTDKYTLALVERIDRNSTPDTTADDSDFVDGLATLNYGDSRFQRGSLQYAWPNVSAEGLNRMLGIEGFNIDAQDFTTMTTKDGKIVEKVDLNILNPISQSEGATKNKRMRVRIMESLTPTTWKDKVTGETRTGQPKINPSTSEVLTKDGKSIYVDNKCGFTNGSVPHQMIQHDKVAVEVDNFETAETEISMI